MRKIALFSVAAVLISGPTFAQQAAPVTIPASLAQSIYLHLLQGGTAASATRLAEDLQDAVLAPQREAELRKKIEAELKAKAEADVKAKADKSAATASTPAETPASTPSLPADAPAK